MTNERKEQVRLFVSGYCSMVPKPRDLQMRMRVQRALLRETAWQFGVEPEEVMDEVFDEFNTNFPH